MLFLFIEIFLLFQGKVSESSDDFMFKIEGYPWGIQLY